MQFFQEGNERCLAAGQMICDAASKKGINLKEAFRFREDITTANSGALFTTVLAATIREVVEPVMVGLELLQMNTDLMNGGGKGALKLPKEKKVTAAVVAEGGTITYTGEGYDFITVTPYKVVAASKITWEMIKRGMVSLIVAEAKRCGKALARKIDYDIIAGLWNVVDPANSNRIATGGASTRVSYDNLIDCRALMEGLDYKPTHLILHPDDYAALCKDDDFKEALYRGNVTLTADHGANMSIFPKVEYFSEQKIVVTSQITSGNSMFVDSNEAGTFVKETEIEVVDGRLPGQVDSEVIAVIAYGIGIERVNAVAGVEMAAS
ncbi:MAG: phage major capsid protein [Candidatus Hodarchaeales archaeon]